MSAGEHLDPRLVLIATAGPGDRPDPERVRAAIRGGVTVVQARGKGLSTGEFLAWARLLEDLCRGAGVPLVVNDRVDIAFAVDAAGAHVGPLDLPPEAARRVLGSRWLGVSVRDAARLAAAEAARADYLGVGALRKTGTKPEARVLGPSGIAAVAGRTRIPVVAVGGVRPGDLPGLRRSGVAGVAVASGILDAADPQAAARGYREAWSGPPEAGSRATSAPSE